MRGLVAEVANVMILAWWLPSFVADVADTARRHAPDWAVRWSRRLCVLALTGWFVAIAAQPPHFWVVWLFTVFYPFYWHSVHKRFHKDKHGRRLLDAANGLVERRGNRLAVAPVEVSR